MDDPGPRWRIHITFVSDKHTLAVNLDDAIDQEEVTEIIKLFLSAGVEVEAYDIPPYDPHGKCAMCEMEQHEQALLLLQEGVTWAETKRRVG